jgi:hypothetical protein
MTTPAASTHYDLSEFAEKLHLCTSHHSSMYPDRYSIMEAVSVMAAEQRSHQPRSVEAVLGMIVSLIADNVTDDTRQKLIPLIPGMIGTAGDHKGSARVRALKRWIWTDNIPMWVHAASDGSQYVPAIIARSGPVIMDRAPDQVARTMLREPITAARQALEATYAPLLDRTENAYRVAMLAPLSEDYNNATLVTNAMTLIAMCAQELAAITVLRRTPTVHSGRFATVLPVSVCNSVRHNLLAGRYNTPITQLLDRSIKNALAACRNGLEESLVTLVKEITEL